MKIRITINDQPVFEIEAPDGKVLCNEVIPPPQKKPPTRGPSLDDPKRIMEVLYRALHGMKATQIARELKMADHSVYTILKRRVEYNPPDEA